MDMYTMSDTFLAQDVVDEFVSAIWTERYSKAGDCQLVVPATSEMIEKLQEGTYLGLRGTKEVMELKTQSIEKGLLTVVGDSLVKFLDERPAWFRNPAGSPPIDNRIMDRVVTGKPGQLIADVVEDMVINTTAFPGTPGSSLYDANLQWDLEELPGLELGAVDVSGADEEIIFTVGPLYSSIAQVAEKYGVGISLYLEEAKVETGFVLKFKTYRGVDRTTGSGNELVRLLPALDSLSDIKELHSIANYKNVAYVFYQGKISVHYEDPLNIPEGFARRVLVTDAVGEPVGRKLPPGQFGYWNAWSGSWSNYTVPDIPAFLEQNAKDALANHNYIRAIDGQTSPENDYKFGVNYFLGDIIELQGITGNIAEARITEYVRSQDKTGEREYPTISVL
jgi:hypothetical protein